jgi:alpha-galactosidase
MNLNILKAPKIIVKNNDNMIEESYEIATILNGDHCRYSFTNTSAQSLKLKEIVISEFHCNESTTFFGEGYNMLSQYGGTISNPKDISLYSDRDHYKMPTEEGKFTVYNLLILNENVLKHLIAFSSCNRFRGEFRLSKNTIEIVICLEGITVERHETVNLEEIYFGSSNNMNTLFSAFGKRVNANHKMLELKETPVGWCSWYCYGPDITKDLMLNNINVMNESMQGIKYILIDDGYQKNMGDWLVENDCLGIKMEDLCKNIKERNMEPAIWIAPFITDENSILFKNHPDWFVADDNNKPLCSEEVTFGGWRLTPWYMLDTTNPEAQNYLYEVFSHMKNKWGCNYFKLDANNWGALPFGKRYKKNATCIESYRMGMQKILEAIGEDGILLGCNAPMWPSLGLVHCMRVSTDISRNWRTVKQVSIECFNRAYQNDIMWKNDPDCAVIKDLSLSLFDPAAAINNENSKLTEDEKIYHLTSLLAVRGLKFFSDRMCELSKDDFLLLQKVIDINFCKIVFLMDDFSIAMSKEKNGINYVLFFNNSDDVIVRNIHFIGKRILTNLWSDVRSSVENSFETTLKPHSAQAYIIEENLN